jgi:N-dimethylarginine dimethylaminohydrolase
VNRPHILMSPPDHFEVFYAINPWMDVKIAVDKQLAKRQWQELREALSEQADISVVDSAPGLPDLVFTANAAFVVGRKAVIARFKNAERQPEEPHYERWFRENGFEVVLLPRDTSFEGAGDALIYDDRLILAGYRQRTDVLAHQRLSQEFGLPTLSLELPHPHFYHIDVCLCPLPRGHLLYYPGAFDEYGLRVIHANVPEEKRLEVSIVEARQFACNAVSVGNTVFANQISARLREALRRRGFQTVSLNLSEFIKAGGSAKCLTLRLN